MTQPHPIAVQNFSHICVGVSDIEASCKFYTAVLGMDIVFDVELEGAGLDSVTGGAAQQGRMVGGLIGAAMVELLSLGAGPAIPRGPPPRHRSAPPPRRPRRAPRRHRRGADVLHLRPRRHPHRTARIARWRVDHGAALAAPDLNEPEFLRCIPCP